MAKEYYPTKFPCIWLTDEEPPRKLTVRGSSAIDPDVWVAEVEGEERSAWIIKHSLAVIHETTRDTDVKAVPVTKPGPKWNGEGAVFT